MFFGIDIISEFITLSDNIEKVGAMKVLPPHNKGGMECREKTILADPLKPKSIWTAVLSYLSSFENQTERKCSDPGNLYLLLCAMASYR